MSRPTSNVFLSLFDPHLGAEEERKRREADIEEKRQHLLVRWGKHPWSWLSGIDTTTRTEDFPYGVPVVWTKDEGKKGHEAIQPFPAHRRHLRYFIELIHNEPKVLVDKPRQMTISWTTCLYIDWDCAFSDVRRWLLSKTREEDAHEMLRDKPRFVAQHIAETSPWITKRMPRSEKPAGRIDYPESGSYFLGVPMNVADRSARGGTASGVFIDEAARQAYLKQIIDAIEPMATRIIAVTTAELGNPGADFFKLLLEEGGGAQGSAIHDFEVATAVGGPEGAGKYVRVP